MLRHMLDENAYEGASRMSTARRAASASAEPGPTIEFLRRDAVGGGTVVVTMKRKPKLTKRQRKALAPPRPVVNQPQHIHCIACGRHIEESDFEAPATATVITCAHGSNFPACVRCMTQAIALVNEHDRTTMPVKVAPAWH